MVAAHAFSPSHHATEYWFFKVNSGPVALLVDWIARRRQPAHVLHVSIHSPQGRAVVFDHLQSPMQAENFLNQDRTAGHVEGIAWALEIDCKKRPH